MNSISLKKTNWLCSGIAFCLLMVTGPGWSESGEHGLGDVSDGNRSVPVHVIALQDEEGETIHPDDQPLMPFSTRKTCGQCHNYGVIAQGWHFNAMREGVDPGAKGEPWVLYDSQAAVQLPLSWRAWPGTYSPKQVGMSRWQFAKQFARHSPGGIVEDTESQEADLEARWWESGELEINCLACHDGEYAHDQAEYSGQVEAENFRWAGAATSGFTSISGAAKDMPAMWDPYMGETGNDPSKKPPSVWYDRTRFLERDKVAMDICREVPSQRCYFCHTTVDTRQSGFSRYKAQEDVHMKAGLTCTDCHRHGLDHAMPRGYPGEPLAQKDAYVETLSCQGCHLGLKEEFSSEPHRPQAGRLGAPYPEHKGIPTVHFRKLACTACHSGAWPEQEAALVKTSRAHGLGLHNVNKKAQALPHIYAPVFTERQDGKISPHKLLWPAFWGYRKDGQVAPLSVQGVGEAAGDLIAQIQPGPNGNWPELTDEQIQAVLEALGQADSEKGEPVYVCGGKLYSMLGTGGTGKLTGVEDPSAKAYMWSYGHPVRPASQSLGLGGAAGCAHCHTTGAPFFFGEVVVDGPRQSDRQTVRMVDLQESVGGNYIWAFNMSFIFRPWMKLTVLTMCALLTGFLMLYLMRAFSTLVRFFSGGRD